MLKKSASFVLAALGGSTYRTEYVFASSLAAAALDGLFDHPAGCSDAVPDLLECCVAPVQKGFFNNLLVNYFSNLPSVITSLGLNFCSKGTANKGIKKLDHTGMQT